MGFIIRTFAFFMGFPLGWLMGGWLGDLVGAPECFFGDIFGLFCLFGPRMIAMPIVAIILYKLAY